MSSDHSLEPGCLAADQNGILVFVLRHTQDGGWVGIALTGPELGRLHYGGRDPRVILPAATVRALPEEVFPA